MLLAVAAVAFAWLVAVAPAAVAQTEVVVYDLVDVWLDPVISHPREAPQEMAGSFEWTYVVGDFENGSGQFLSLALPWWGLDMTELQFTFDTTSIEINLVGNYHDLGVDVSLFLVQPLAPYLPSTIDTVRSKFDIQVGVSHQGSVISGSIVPRIPTCPGIAHLALANQTVDWTETFEACLTITAGPALAIMSPGSVTLRSGREVIFLDGVSMQDGAELTVEIDPSLMP